jgi:hypothetical protein
MLDDDDDDDDDDDVENNNDLCLRILLSMSDTFYFRGFLYTDQ